MKYEEFIDYLLEKEKKKDKSIREQVNETKCEMNERGITFDETSLEICKILKEDSDSSLVAIQGTMSFVISVLAIYISCVDTTKSIILPNGIDIYKCIFLIIPILAAGYSVHEMLKIKRISREGVRLRNKTIAALIQMQEEKKEIDKNEKNA